MYKNEQKFRYRDLRYPLKLCWCHFGCDDDSDWIEIPEEDKIPEEDIVWRGQGNLDAALIRCRRPPEALGWGIVSSDKPLDLGRWLEAVQPEKGVSGMPVFAGRKIIGVARSVPPNADAIELDAIPTWRLLEDENFRRTIGYDEQAARIDSVKGDLAKALARSPDAIGVLEEKLRLDDEMAGLDYARRAERLAERLLPEADSRVVIDTLWDVHRSLCEDGEAAEQGREAAEIIAKAAQLVVPAVYDYGVVNWTRSQKGSDGVAPTPLPAGIKTVAEIIMAGVDGRKTKFRYRESEQDYPEGELSLPQLPECGIDPGGANAREALQKHLEVKFTPEKVEGLRRAVDDYLIATKYPSEPGKERVIPWEQRIKPTADQIARETRVTKQTFYSFSEKYFLLFLQ